MHAALLPLVLLFLTLVLGQGAGANQGQRTICCRSSGGTRGSCLNLWAHLVPTSNRFQPGPSRLIALLQGPSASANTMTVQVLSLQGELLVDQTLPAEREALWLLTLPKANQPGFSQPLQWESFPSCRSDISPTRTILEAGNGSQGSGVSILAQLKTSCGREVATNTLLRQFELEDWSNRLQTSLPIRCVHLRAIAREVVTKPENRGRP